MSTTKKTTKEVTVIEDNAPALVEARPSGVLSLPNACGIEVTHDDIDVPRINIVQKLSSIEAPVAAIVLDKRHVLAHEDEPLHVTILAVMKAWRENVPFESNEISRVAKTQVEADEIQKDSDYNMIEFAEITLLFKQPDDNEDDEAYCFPIGDNNYAMGRINVQKDAYRQTYKRITTFAAFNPKARLHEYQWVFKSSLIQRGALEWYAPSLSVTKNRPDEAVVDFIGGFAG